MDARREALSAVNQVGQLYIKEAEGEGIDLRTVDGDQCIATVEPSGEPMEWKLFQNFSGETGPRCTFLYGTGLVAAAAEAVQAMNRDNYGYIYELVDPNV